MVRDTADIPRSVLYSKLLWTPCCLENVIERKKKQVWATTSQFTPPIPLIYQSNDPNSFVSQSNHSTILATLSPRHIFIPIDFKVEIWNLIHWCAKIQRGFTFLPPKPIWVVWKVVIPFIGQNWTIFSCQSVCFSSQNALISQIRSNESLRSLVGCWLMSLADTAEKFCCWNALHRLTGECRFHRDNVGL